MSYMVTAKRWEHGWELHIAGAERSTHIGVTQSRTLADAERMVRDYLRLDEHPDWKTATVHVVPDLGSLREEVQRVKERSRAAETAQREAARDAREVARRLRQEGLSVTDTAVVLGVSRGRVSQLVKEAP